MNLNAKNAVEINLKNINKMDKCCESATYCKFMLATVLTNVTK